MTREHEVAMRAITISSQLALPMDTQTQTLVVYGNKGMGKTNFGAVLAEELAAARLRFAVLDPMGNWWGLRHSANGHGAGVEVLILGGRHGDMPIEPTAGAVVADLVADEEVNVIIDISRRADGKMWGRGERIRFVADYATRLYERQGERMRPIMQIIDEAAGFIPQMIPHGSPDLARCTGAIETLVEEGRNIGVGVCLITQRSARMNKSVSELAECMIAFRTIGPNSIAAIMDWLGDHVPKTEWAGMVEQIRKFPLGQALIVSPGWLKHEGIVPIRQRSTFDSSATPRPGQERRVSGQGAKPNLERYRERMAATIEKAQAEDPKALRARIVELERGLKVAQSQTERAGKGPIQAQIQPKRVEIPVLKDSQIREIDRAAERLERISVRMIEAADGAAKAATDLRDNTKIIGDNQVGLLSSLRQPPPPATVQPILIHAGGQEGTRERPLHGKSRYGKSQYGPRDRILGSLAWWQVVGVDKPAREQVAFGARYTVNGHFNNILSELRASELISYPGPNLVSLTPNGVAAAAPFLPRSGASRDDLVDRIRMTIRGGPARKIFDALVTTDTEITREDLARLAEYTVNGHFNNEVSYLHSAGVIKYPRPGTVALGEVFEGLR